MKPLVYRHNSITRLTHWINAIALTILFMSGLQIFNAFPHLHWGSKAEPGEALVSISATNQHGHVRGYLEFLGHRIDTTGLLGVQLTESGPTARAFPSWITIPGYFWLAGGRRWHFFFGWLFAINGLLYFVYNLLNGHMRKFLFTPRDAAKVPAMILYYLHLRRESPQDGEYNPLQKMAYTSVFVILTPLVLFSGMAMSPQLDVAFNWLPAMFGGRQSARSVHFILAFGFASFTFGHIFMVLTTGVLNNMRSMVTGWYREKIPSHKEPPRAPTPSKPKLEEPSPTEEKPQPPSETPVVAVAQQANLVTAKPRRKLPSEPLPTPPQNKRRRHRKMPKGNLDLSRRRLVFGALQGTGLLLLSGCEKMFNGLQENKKFLALLESAEGASQGVQRLLTGRHKLAKEFTERDISRTFKANGNPPPATTDYRVDATKGWASWRLEVSGLVKQPIRYSLDELRSLPSRSQITRHDCVEGWSAIAKWKGVPLAEIARRAQPTPEARYVVFHCMDTDEDGSNYYESLNLVDANHPQTILAYEMNDRALPVEHGAPLRLRVETQLGYKHAKYIQKIEFVADFKSIQKGNGGYWEDQGYEWYAGI